MDAMDTRNSALKVPPKMLLREPLSWAAVSAFTGTAVGLAGTFRLAAWLGDPYGSLDTSPVLVWLAAPFGRLLVALSLLGVLPLLEGGPRPAGRVARILGIPLVLLSLLVFLTGLSLELGWVPLGEAWSGGPPLLFAAFGILALCLPPVAGVPFAVASFLCREPRLAAVLLGLCVLAAPWFLVWQSVSGGVRGEITLNIAAIVLLGGLWTSMSLLEAPLWVLFGAMLFRGARARAVGEAERLRSEENLEAARRLYEEGLGAGDASVVDALVSEGFRDLKSGARGRLGMERVFSALRRSYPDLSVSVENQEAEGDLVGTRLLMSGTDEGGVLWYPPTGRSVSFEAEFSDRFEEGELVEHAGREDTEGLLRQLGHHEEEGRLDNGPNF